MNTETTGTARSAPRRVALDPTGDPRKMVSAVVAVFVRDRGFADAQDDLKEYFRACLRIARRQGRQEGKGR